MFLLNSCTLTSKPNYEHIEHFNLGDIVYDEITNAVNEAVINKKSLNDLTAALKLRVGSIVYIDRYNSHSRFSHDQNNLADVFKAAQLNKDEWLIVMGFELDQICYVICDKSDVVVRGVSLPKVD